MMKVLLAEDQELFAELFRDVMEAIEEKFDKPPEIVGVEPDGLSFLEKFNKLIEENVKIDLVFLDIRMPEMDGLSVLVNLKFLDNPPKIIMISSEDISTVMLEGSIKNYTGEGEKSEEESFKLLNEKIQTISNSNEDKSKMDLLNFCERMRINPFWAASALGANAYIKKPYSPDNLIKVIKHVMESDDFLIVNS